MNHARRVVDLLGLGPIGEGGLFEDVTYCDYGNIGTLANGEGELVCKPKAGMFRKAMEEAGISDPEKCYFVGKWIRRLGEMGKGRANENEL